MEPRKLLSDILANGQRDTIASAWDRTAAANDFAPLPAGKYICHVLSVGPFTGRTNHTPGVKITFKVIEGEYAGRHIWHDAWLTQAAMPMTKRDLGKLGITALEQLDLPVPPGIKCEVKVVLRTDDDGTQFSRVKRFEFIGIDAPEPNPFAPAPPPAGDLGPPVDPSAVSTTAPAAPDEGDTTFDPERLEAEGGGS